MLLGGRAGDKKKVAAIGNCSFTFLIAFFPFYNIFYVSLLSSILTLVAVASKPTPFDFMVINIFMYLSLSRSVVPWVSIFFPSNTAHSQFSKQFESLAYHNNHERFSRSIWIQKPVISHKTDNCFHFTFISCIWDALCASNYMCVCVPNQTFSLSLSLSLAPAANWSNVVT